MRSVFDSQRVSGNCVYDSSQPSSNSAATTGTTTASITESDIVSGGKTIILTLTGDTWIAAGVGSFDLQRQNIINGLTSAQSETLGWNLVVKALQGVTGVVRTSSTVVTITLDAQATYDITATETITATIPATALVGNAAIVSAPTFTVTAITAVVVSLTLAAFNLTPKSEQLAITPQLTKASLVFVPKNPQLAIKNQLSSANLKLTPQNPQLSLINRLSAASLVFVGKALDVTNTVAGTVISLTTASLNFVAQPIQNKLVTNLSTAALKFTAKQTTNSLALRLTAGALNFAAQPTSNTLRIVLSTAVLRFTTGAITVSGAVDSVLNRLRVMMGIGQ